MSHFEEAIKDRTILHRKYAGYKYVVAHNEFGYRCGYVIVPKGHPWHGRSDMESDAAIMVHGGITFADFVNGEWWVGFDCAHAGDAPDPNLPGSHNVPIAGNVVRTTAYVEGECRKLIDQAINVADNATQILYELKQLAEAEAAASQIKRKLFDLGYGVSGSWEYKLEGGGE